MKNTFIHIGLIIVGVTIACLVGYAMLTGIELLQLPEPSMFAQGVFVGCMSGLTYSDLANKYIKKKS